jgi:hypothetical protein
MTLDEFKALVKNRPEPDTPGFYRLTVHHWCGTDACPKDASVRYSADLSGELLRRCKNVQGADLRVWRYRSHNVWRLTDHEYYATFEEAYEAMLHTPETQRDRNSLVDEIIGYSIERLGFGRLGVNDFYVSYHNYDARFREIGHSVCSSYHYEQPGIYGTFLGRFPEELCKPGDIVEFRYCYGDGEWDYNALGVVLKAPASVEDSWQPEINLEDNICRGADEDEYFIRFAPSTPTEETCCYCNAQFVRTPAFSIPAEAHELLNSYYKLYPY